MPHISPLALKNMTVFTLWEVSQGDNNWCDFNFRQKAFFQGGNWGNERFHTPVEFCDHLDLELELENQVLRLISVKESRTEYSGKPTARRPLGGWAVLAELLFDPLSVTTTGGHGRRWHLAF